ncbi:hypothetical protein KRMM14A1259_17480 [Krasilnikovia sp. MM14-A1259]
MPQLRQACTRILDAIENRHGPTLDVIELGGGPYWMIVPAAAQLLHPEPEQQVTVGDTVDDADELPRSPAAARTSQSLSGMTPPISVGCSDSWRSSTSRNRTPRGEWAPSYRRRRFRPGPADLFRIKV